MASDPIITADDVVRVGACFDGVRSVIERANRAGRNLPAAAPVSAVLRLLTPHERSYVLRAAELDDYGVGYGDGDGSGSGDGSGDGSGYGSGYGSGSGDGGLTEDAS